ncbi:hypothetical protein HNR21_004502 [Actinomadura cellulosilytica]|uniref:CU044_5270 family protein n=2 Tax=Thermomonospora cellulosilytica TaxID=1411118 RepID=A0A7W3N142_9ACTN|nr:hypothetical protein [Thermomonospora cellulosilytica]
MDEMTRLENLRAEVPVPDPADLRAEEERLMAAVSGASVAERPGRRAFRPRRGSVVMLAAAGTALVLAGGTLAVRGDDPSPRRPVVHVMPNASVEVLDRAADHAPRTELRPRPGQYLVFETESMAGVEGDVGGGVYGRYLSRGRRTTWWPVNGPSLDAVVLETVLPARPYPGYPLPATAPRTARTGVPEKLLDFDQRPEYLRTDYAYLSRLPADPRGMYRHLYTGLGDDEEAHREAWSRVLGMLYEAYMPAPQRAALFRAAGAIPGVTVVRDARDGTGRKGVAAARIDRRAGTRVEYVFDPRTYAFLGERTVVVDPAVARAPAGTVLSYATMLKAGVVDKAPIPRPRD